MHDKDTKVHKHNACRHHNYVANKLKNFGKIHFFYRRRVPTNVSTIITIYKIIPKSFHEILAIILKVTLTREFP